MTSCNEHNMLTGIGLFFPSVLSIALFSATTKKLDFDRDSHGCEDQRGFTPCEDILYIRPRPLNVH